MEHSQIGVGVNGQSAAVPTMLEVMGHVSDLENGRGMAGVRVRITSADEPSDTIEGVTDGLGFFMLSFSKPGPVSIVAETEGYAPQAQIFRLDSGVNPVELKMQPVTFIQEAVVTPDMKSLEIKVPDNSVRVELSDPSRSLGATGRVRAEITVGDPRENREAFPGGFMAVGPGGNREVVELASVIFANITLRDPEGRIISELGKPAKVQMKIPTGSVNPATSIPFKDGDTIPLYYLDEKLGTWVPEMDEEGQHVVATVLEQPDGLYSEFTARHFSWWNCDQPVSVRSCVRGRVIDPCGKPMANMRVCGRGVSFNGANCNGLLGNAALQFGLGSEGYKEKTTAEDGKFCVDALRGHVMDVQIGTGGNEGFYSYSFDQVLKSHRVTLPTAVATCADPHGTCLDLGDIYVMPTARVVVGKVLGDTGNPLAHAVIQLAGKMGRADENGHFRLDVGPGDNLELVVTHPDGSRFGRRITTVDIPGLTPSPGQCEAVPPVDVGPIAVDTELGCVRGKVRDENGQPVKGAHLAISGFITDTDDGGNYCLTGLKGEHEFNLSFYDRGRGRMHRRSSALQMVGGGQCGGGEERCVHADAEIELGDACISGTVTDQKGRALAGASLRIGSSMVTTGPDGSYCILAPPRLQAKMRFKYVTGAQGGGGSEAEITADVMTGGAGQCGLGCTLVNQAVVVNEPPVIEKIEAKRTDVRPKEDIVVTATASDPEGTALAYFWSASDGDLGESSSSQGQPILFSGGPITSSVSWRAPSRAGTYTVSVRIQDEAKGSALAGVEIQVGQAQGQDGASGGAVCGAEVCDGLDNDCDGAVDEDASGGLCTTNLPGICSEGRIVCASGKLTCVQKLAPTSEVCGDGSDNDCDGAVDNGCVCVESQIRSCYGGPSGSEGVGLCKAGLQTCSGNRWGACTSQVLPSVEICDANDNDCDSGTDEGGVCLPVAPSNLTATAVSSKEVQLSWADLSTHEEGFRIDRRPASGSWSLIANTTANATSYGDAGLSAGTEYFYRVLAYNGFGVSTYSNEAAATTRPDGAAVFSAGRHHACAVRTDETLWCWGANGFGQLGDGTTLARPAPTRVGMNADWFSVAAAAYHTCAIKTNGSLWCWGPNGAGQLGDGTTVQELMPSRVGTDADWALVASGDSHTCAIKANGSLWCWGVNGAGQLGDGTNASRSTPTEIVSGGDWSVVAAGWAHTCATKKDGTLWCWGHNDTGRLGDGTTTFRSVPTRVGTDADWVSVSNGIYHTCGLKADASLWCWGGNFSGQLGMGTSDVSNSLVPARVGVADDWAGVEAGSEHTCAVKTNSSAWCWGANGYGQVGDGALTDRSAPVRVGAEEVWTLVGAGRSYSCGLRNDGGLWCWGANGAGELGNGTIANKRVPTQIGSDGDWSQVAAGEFHTCGLRANGTLWCTGGNWGGEVGDGTSISKSVLTQVGNGVNWAWVGTGNYHTCAVKTDGTIWCWGYNWSGQLGDGSTIDKTTPTQVGTQSDWSVVGGGLDHTCGLKTDETLWCWGDLWSGSSWNSKTPVQMGTEAGWTSMDSGSYHMCTCNANGTLWCWGDNGYGQLGIGSSIGYAATLTQVGADTDWSGVTAGEDHTCATKTNGTLWCWGKGDSGQLGDGVMSATLYTPTRIGTDTDWASVQTGIYHTCATKTNGTLWCWGGNWYGQLGDGSVTSRNSPTQIGSATGWAALAGGWSHTCGTRVDGALWCWGDSEWGQLGDGTAWSETPLIVSLP